MSIPFGKVMLFWIFSMIFVLVLLTMDVTSMSSSPRIRRARALRRNPGAPIFDFGKLCGPEDGGLSFKARSSGHGLCWGFWDMASFGRGR